MAVLSAVGITTVPIRDCSTYSLASFSLCLKHCTNFLTRITGKPLVEQILEGGKIISILEKAVVVIVDEACSDYDRKKGPPNIPAYQYEKDRRLKIKRCWRKENDGEKEDL